MTSHIFRTWLNKVDQRMTVQGRKILMLVDNCPAHPVVEGLKSIELMFLPPNCTSVLQPMDQGIIRLFKFHYRKLSLKMIVEHINQHGQHPTEKLNVLQAIRFAKTAWTNVSAECINNCFLHGFYGSTRAARMEVDGGEIEALLTAAAPHITEDLPIAGKC